MFSVFSVLISVVPTVDVATNAYRFFCAIDMCVNHTDSLSLNALIFQNEIQILALIICLLLRWCWVIKALQCHMFKMEIYPLKEVQQKLSFHFVTRSVGKSRRNARSLYDQTNYCRKHQTEGPRAEISWVLGQVSCFAWLLIQLLQS